jgi:hypothetical protein
VGYTPSEKPLIPLPIELQWTAWPHAIDRKCQLGSSGVGIGQNTSIRMNLNELFSSVEMTMLARFKESGFIQHSGDKGENREEILREFLQKHLPKRYGVTKGEVITKEGQRSHAIDIIICDTVNCPILYAEKTSILPVEGIYGIIEAKSSLSKHEFEDAASKIESFKKLAPRDLGVIRTREYFTVQVPSMPFGIVFGYQLAGNSLESLKNNWEAQCAQVHYVQYFVNLICVMSEGLLRFEHVDLVNGEKHLLIDTERFFSLIATWEKRVRNNEGWHDLGFRTIIEGTKDKTFGRFFTYLLILLTGMKLNVPDLGRYIDPTNLPMTTTRE